MRRLGFSTGFMHKKINPVSKQAIDICRSASLGAIEINCIGGLEDNGKSIFDINALLLCEFGHVSLHSPSKIRYGDDEPTRQVLAYMQDACRVIPIIKNIVFHPDLVDCWEVLDEFNIPYAFENMDNRKNFGMSVADMEKIFSMQGDADFVLDLNHCFSRDPSMAIAKDMLSEFCDRLCEIHLSGFDGHHALLCETKQEKIMEAMLSTEVPIILESSCNSLSDVKKEFDYVFQYLSNH